MELFLQGAHEALRLLLDRNPLVTDAAARTLQISLAAVGLAALLGLPMGLLLARWRHRGARLLLLAARAGMGLPTVLVGILCYGLFSRRGPLGPLDLLYTPGAMVAGELLLALPIVVALTQSAVGALDPRVEETARTLGASPWRRSLTSLSEARTGVLLAILTAFARCATELGIAMMVGGNIKARTRTLATATALETGKGEFARGMAMGLLLLALALAVALVMAALERERRR